MVKACLKDNDPDFVQVSVTDTGRGISPEAKSLIFERLYQDPNSVDDSRKGLGLGLYISKELVRLHGGQIWVRANSLTAAPSSLLYRCFRWQNFWRRLLLTMDVARIPLPDHG